MATGAASTVRMKVEMTEPAVERAELEELRQQFDRLAEALTAAAGERGNSAETMLAEMQRLSDRILELQTHPRADVRQTPVSADLAATAAPPAPGPAVTKLPGTEATAGAEPRQPLPATSMPIDPGSTTEPGREIADADAEPLPAGKGDADSGAPLFGAAIRSWIERERLRAATGVNEGADVAPADAAAVDRLRAAIERQTHLVETIVSRLENQQREFARLEERAAAALASAASAQLLAEFRDALDRQRRHLTALAIAVQRLAQLLAARLPRRSS